MMRVLPRENEAVNECWISDRDRFSYEGLYADDRLTAPMVKHDGVWHQASWQDALNAAAGAVGLAVKNHGGEDSVSARTAHNAGRGDPCQAVGDHLGGATIDHRLRVSDAALDQGGGIPWLGFKLANIAEVDRFLVIGSSLRQGATAAGTTHPAAR